MNMCMIQDDDGNVLVQDKMIDGFRGITFPRGHVDAGEAFTESVVREMQEKTGLRIYKPKLCGIYHWRQVRIRKVVYLYWTSEFEGKLNSSEKGEAERSIY